MSMLKLKTKKKQMYYEENLHLQNDIAKDGQP